MSQVGAVTAAVAAMAHADLDEPQLAEQVCRAYVDGLDVDGAAMSLLTGTTSRVTLATTDPTARLLEDLQFTLNEGACMEAAATGRPVLVTDVHDTSLTGRWPLFAAEVTARSEVAALFALPLQWGAVNLGVLDLYRTTPGLLDDVEWYDAAAAADTTALLIIGRRTDPAPLAAVETASGAPGSGAPGGGAPDAGSLDGHGWLDQVAGHSAEIYQAIGMVQVQLGVPGVDALARMRGHAFTENRLLVDVARDIVERRLDLAESGPP